MDGGIKSMKLFLDCETTGLPTSRDLSYKNVNNWPFMVSIAWAFLDGDNKQLNNRYYIVKPDRYTIPADATRIHGITTEEAIEKGISSRSVIEMLLDDIDSFGPDIIVAHNIDFDLPVVLAECERLNINTVLNSLTKFCTMKASTNYCKLPPKYSSRSRFKGYKWPKLEELHQVLFKKQFENAHNAEADLQVCIKCYLELIKLGLGNEPDVKRKSISSEIAITKEFNSKKPNHSPPSKPDLSFELKDFNQDDSAQNKEFNPIMLGCYGIALVCLLLGILPGFLFFVLIGFCFSIKEQFFD